VKAVRISRRRKAKNMGIFEPWPAIYKSFLAAIAVDESIVLPF